MNLYRMITYKAKQIKCLVSGTWGFLFLLFFSLSNKKILSDEILNVYFYTIMFDNSHFLLCLLIHCQLHTNVTYSCNHDAFRYKIKILLSKYNHNI